MKQFIYFARFLKKYLLLQICYSIIGILCYFGGLCLNSLEFKFAGIGCITKVFTDIHRRRNRGKGGGLSLYSLLVKMSGICLYPYPQLSICFRCHWHLPPQICVSVSITTIALSFLLALWFHYERPWTQSFIKWCSFVRQWCYLERPKYITNYNWNCFSCQSLIENSKNTKTLYNKGGLGAICMTIFIDKNFKNPLYVHVV